MNTMETINFHYGELQSTLKLYEEQLKINKEIRLTKNTETAKTLYYIGNMYRLKGEYENAIQFLQEALEIEKERYPANHHSIADTLNSIGNVYLSKRELENALKTYKEALNIYKVFIKHIMLRSV